MSKHTVEVPSSGWVRDNVSSRYGEYVPGAPRVTAYADGASEDERVAVALVERNGRVQADAAWTEELTEDGYWVPGAAVAPGDVKLRR